MSQQFLYPQILHVKSSILASCLANIHWYILQASWFKMSSGCMFIPYTLRKRPFPHRRHASVQSGCITIKSLSQPSINNRADSRFAPSQWETSLQSNAVSHWLGANLESALNNNNAQSEPCGVFKYHLKCIAANNTELNKSIILVQIYTIHILHWQVPCSGHSNVRKFVPENS